MHTLKVVPTRVTTQQKCWFIRFQSVNFCSKTFIVTLKIYKRKILKKVHTWCWLPWRSSCPRWGWAGPWWTSTGPGSWRRPSGGCPNARGAPFFSRLFVNDSIKLRDCGTRHYWKLKFKLLSAADLVVILRKQFVSDASWRSQTMTDESSKVKFVLLMKNKLVRLCQIFFFHLNWEKRFISLLTNKLNFFLII